MRTAVRPVAAADERFAADRARQREIRTFKPGTSEQIREEWDGSIFRVRLHEVRVNKGTHNGQQARQRTITYLDGRVDSTLYTDSKTHQEVTLMPASAMPARTKDVVDFGRLQNAVTELVKTMQRFDADNPMSPEQEESVLRSYQSILSWRNKARATMAEAEGQIDVAQSMIQNMLK